MEPAPDSQPRGARARRRTPPFTDAICIAAAFAVLYLILGQKSWYKIDGQITILRFAEGGPGHPRHLLADEILRLFLPLTDLFGRTTYEGVRAFSALGAAASSLALHRSCALLGLSRLRCGAAQLALLCTPGLVFYASVVEFHAPFLAIASLAFWATTRLGLRGELSVLGLVGAAVCGVLSALAYFQHASGQVLPALLLPWLFVLLRRRPVAWTSSAILATTLAVVHFGVAKLVPFAIRRYELLPRFAPEATTDAGAMSYVTWHFDTMSWSELRHVPTTLAYEWLLPFAAVSILAFVTSARAQSARALPGARAALAVALLPYLAITFLLMRHEHEFGAYALPCALLACVLASCSVPTRTLMLASLLSLCAGIVNVRLSDDGTRGRALERRVEAAQLQDSLVLLVAGEAERDDALMALSNRRFAQYLWLQEEVLRALPVAQTKAWFEAQHDSGRRVAATRSALAILERVEPVRALLRRESCPELGAGYVWLRLEP